MNFTALMPIYHGDTALRLSEAIKSCLRNSLPPTQLLLSIDGPICSQLSNVLDDVATHPAVQILKFSDNVGLAEHLNRTLNFVDNEFVIRCDADDVNDIDRFRKLMDKLNNGYDLVGSQIIELDAKSGTQIVRHVPLDASDIKKFSTFRSPFNHMSVAYRVSKVRAVGGYPLILFREDYALWSLMLQANVKCCNLDEVLVTASGGADLIARRGGLKALHAEFHLQRFFASKVGRNVIICIFAFLMRSLIFVLPPKMLQVFYRNVLRN